MRISDWSSDVCSSDLKMEAIGQLTGGVAHDFNNRRAVSGGNLELLEDRLQDDEGRRLAQQALRNAVRGAELTQRLLAFSRRQKLKPSRIDVNALLTGLQAMRQRSQIGRAACRARVCQYV